MKRYIFFIAAAFILSGRAWCQERYWTEAERSFLVEKLQETKVQLINAVEALNHDQMQFKEEPNRWSILEIVEHLEVQDENYWRELDIIPRGPQLPEYRERVKGNDELLLLYAKDPNKADAGYLHPIGRFGNKEAALKAFSLTRDRIIDFIKTTPKDLRSYFTFRKFEKDGGLSDPGLYDVRDLHQLMLTNIAHTQRHIGQIEKVKAHPDFPENVALEVKKR